MSRKYHDDFENALRNFNNGTAYSEIGALQSRNDENWKIASWGSEQKRLITLTEIKSQYAVGDYVIISWKALTIYGIIVDFSAANVFEERISKTGEIILTNVILHVQKINFDATIDVHITEIPYAECNITKTSKEHIVTNRRDVKIARLGRSED